MDNNIITKPSVIDADFVVAESWIQRKPKMGDHIRVLRIGGLYAHCACSRKMRNFNTQNAKNKKECLLT